MCSSAFKLLCHVLKKWAAISIKSNHLIGFGIADVILLHCIMFYKVVKAARLPKIKVARKWTAPKVNLTSVASFSVLGCTCLFFKLYWRGHLKLHWLKCRYCSLRSASAAAVKKNKSVSFAYYWFKVAIYTLINKYVGDFVCVFVFCDVTVIRGF